MVHWTRSNRDSSSFANLHTDVPPLCWLLCVPSCLQCHLLPPEVMSCVSTRALQLSLQQLERWRSREGSDCASNHVWAFLLLTAPGLAAGEVFCSHSFSSLELLEPVWVKQGEMQLSVKVILLPTLWMVPVT